MLKNILLASVVLLTSSFISSAQTKDTVKEEEIVLQTASGSIYGTLDNPAKLAKRQTIALIISGSGPTDRDGNNQMMKNNSLKMLATELAKNGIASVRFDKRGIAASTASGMAERDLRFENYINDVKDWIKKLKADRRYSKIVIIGHSEGSLIGMIAAETENPTAFVSIAGAGMAADKVIREQLANQLPEIKDTCYAILDKLKAGQTIAEVNPMFNALFRPSVQPYLISWFKYDPQQEISKLQIPVLIMQGNTDIQVTVEQAKQLSQANPKAKLVIVDNMNHILKNAPADQQQNIATYNDPNLPLSAEAAKAIVAFIKDLK